MADQSMPLVSLYHCYLMTRWFAYHFVHSNILGLTNRSSYSQYGRRFINILGMLGLVARVITSPKPRIGAFTRLALCGIQRPWLNIYIV